VIFLKATIAQTQLLTVTKMPDWKAVETYQRLLVAIIAAYDIKPVSLSCYLMMSHSFTVLAQLSHVIARIKAEFFH
jgi:hypothetical protein